MNLRHAKLLLQAATGRNQEGSANYDADCIVALSFGYRLDDQGGVIPGTANALLAKEIARVSRRVPVIAQFEVADALSAIDVATAADFRISRSRVAGAYLDTREVAEQAVEIMKDNGWNRPRLIAHRHHLPRLAAVMTALGVDSETPSNLPAVWDKESQQPWTRSRRSWVLHEAYAIHIYCQRRWIE